MISAAKDAQYDELFGECASEEPGLYIWYGYPSGLLYAFRFITMCAHRRIEYFIPLEIDDDDYPDLKCKPPRPARYSCTSGIHLTAIEANLRFCFCITLAGFTPKTAT